MPRAVASSRRVQLPFASTSSRRSDTSRSATKAVRHVTPDRVPATAPTALRHRPEDALPSPGVESTGPPEPAGFTPIHEATTSTAVRVAARIAATSAASVGSHASRSARPKASPALATAREASV